MKDKFEFKVQDAIQWYEGQLLYPHHYQQMRHEVHQTSLCYLSLFSPWYWGIRTLEIDEALLPTGTLRINKILAIFPDGSVFHHVDGERKLELDLTPFKENLKGDTLKIHLAIVRRQAESANADGDFPRYESIESAPIADENTGDNPISIAKLALKAMLIPDDKLSPRFSSFPLLEISLQSESFQKTNFIPPTTTIDKDEAIGKYFKALITKIRRHIAYLSERLQVLKTEDTGSVLEYYHQVYAVLTSRILVLEALYNAGQCHPFEMFKELNISAGTYCTLSKTKVPPLFPGYNHNDLRGTFDPVMDFIDDIINTVKSPSVSIAMEKEGRTFSKMLKPSYLESEYLIIGVSLDTEVTPAAGSSWIKGAVICAESAIRDVKEKRILGAERQLVEQVSNMGLISGEKQIFVRVKNDRNYLKGDEYLKIFNPSDTEHNRPKDIFLYVVG